MPETRDTFEAYAVREGFVVDCVPDPVRHYPDFYMSVEDFGKVPGFPLAGEDSTMEGVHVAAFPSMEEADLAAHWMNVYGWEGVA